MTSANCTKKYCKGCSKGKPVGEFYPSKRYKCGRNTLCISCVSEYNKGYYGGRREELRERHRLNGQAMHRFRTYGISDEEYDRILKKQKGVCAICGGMNKSGKALHVDHDHNTGEIRGLLCHNCNVALGHAKESPSLLQRMIHYLAT